MDFEDINYALGIADLCVSDHILKEWLDKNKAMFLCNSQINRYRSNNEED
jgi:hypothetical protein